MAETVRKNYQKVEVIAKLFGKTVRRIQQLTQDGILPTEQTPEGRRYDLLPTITRYIKYLEEKASKSPPQIYQNAQLEKAQAEANYKKAKAEKATLELNELKGQMHRAGDIEKLTNELVFAVRSMLLALPGRVAIDLAAIDNPVEVSKYMARHMEALLDELSQHEYNPDTYKKLAREREGWGTEQDDDEEDEADV